MLEGPWKPLTTDKVWPCRDKQCLVPAKWIRFVRSEFVEMPDFEFACDLCRDGASEKAGK